MSHNYHQPKLIFRKYGCNITNCRANLAIPLVCTVYLAVDHHLGRKNIISTEEGNLPIQPSILLLMLA